MGNSVPDPVTQVLFEEIEGPLPVDFVKSIEDLNLSPIALAYRTAGRLYLDEQSAAAISNSLVAPK